MADLAQPASTAQAADTATAVETAAGQPSQSKPQRNPPDNSLRTPDPSAHSGQALGLRTWDFGLRTRLWWQEVFAGPVLALQFLTAIPIPLAMPAAPRHLGRALACFPLVGALLGLALAGLDAGLLRLLSAPPATAIVLVAGVLATGGLHLDGLMDACDGIFGGHTAARRLEIMRDSRVGSYGVLAGALQLLLKYAALSALPLSLRGAALIAALATGRWAMVGATWLFPYARPEGLGAGFKAGVTWRSVALATLFAALVSWASLGPLGFALLAVAGAAAWLTSAYAAGKLGGLTGDCYGAVNEVVESTVLLALLIWVGRLGHV